MSNKLLLAVFLCLTLAHTGKSEELNGIIKSPYDLQEKLFLIQLFSPPAETNSLEYDSGLFAYLPDIDADPAAAFFSEGLVLETDEFGNLLARVSVFEDFESRETIYLNADNEIIFRIPPLSGYNPFWVLEAYYPELNPPEYMVDQYDPSRVVMQAVLLPCKFDPVSGELGQSLPIGGDENKSTEQDALLIFETPGGSEPLSIEEMSTARSTGSETNESSVVIRRQRNNRHIFVDSRNGDDSWNGKSKLKHVVNAPKRSIKEGLKSVKRRGRLFIAKGRYADKIDVRGRKVKVHIKER